MFTGIIQTTAYLIDIKKKFNFTTIFVAFPEELFYKLVIGSSVSNNGCCLTVTNINNNIVSFDIIKETLELTNLVMLNINDKINLERALSLNSEIGGHLMSGHIICTAQLIKIINFDNNKQMWFIILRKQNMKYILYKEYIGIDGISLTISRVIGDYFCIDIIPETLKRTNLLIKKIGNYVNIEVDQRVKVIVDTIERIL